MTAELSARIHTAAVTALAFVCTYVLAFYWNLDRPFWAGFTVFVISLPSIGQTLQKGVLRMFGTVAGAVAALVLLGLFAQERMLLLFVLSLYLCLMLYLMLTSVYYGYAFFISCIVTLIICLMAVHEPQDAFHLSVYRVEETLLGIGVYTVVTLVFSPRTSIKGLYRGVRDLMAGHKALFVMGGEAGAEGQMSRMYAQYVGMRELLDKVGQLIPAVQLEAYQVYRCREYWGRAVRCSAELLELQRRWMGTLVAMKDLDMASLFPHFESRIAELGNLFEQLDALGKEGPPGGSTKPGDVQPLAFDESVFEKLGSTRKGLAFSAVNLFEEQAAHCRELLMLAGFLLHGGPLPELKPSASKKAFSVIKPEQYAYMSQMFVIFWAAALCWILLNPPGLESIAFLELTIVLGLIGIMTGEDKPLRQVLIFALGIGCTGLAYTFIYPLVSNLGGFIVMMGVSGFFITFAFPRKEQNFTKQAFMLPWLSIGNFTNLPTYDFGQLLVGSFTLLFGISIVSLIHYALFMPNTEARFLQRQKAFFRSSETLLLHLRACREQRRGSLFRLGMFFRLHRTRFLAEEIGILARKLPVTFVKPELVRVFSTEVQDMASSMQGLYARLRSVDSDLLCPSQPGTARVPLVEAPLKDRLESMETVVRSMIDGLRESARAEKGPDAHAGGQAVQDLLVSCAGIMKSLSNTLDLMRSLPVEADSRNRF